MRYKQTMIGATWAILEPLLTMLVFTIIFGKFAKIPSEWWVNSFYPLWGFMALGNLRH